MKTFYISLCTLIILSGCAATPQAALDQANNGAALTMGLSVELKKFSDVEQSVMETRQAEIAKNNAVAVRYNAHQVYDMDLLKASNRKAETDLYKTLMSLSDSKAAAERTARNNAEQASKEFDTLLAALPDRTKDVDALTTALSALGQPLSAKEQYLATKDFIDPVRKAIKDSKEKIEEANKKTP